MTNSSSTEFLSAAREVLLENGYKEVQKFDLKGFDRLSYRLFEDPYCVVAIVHFDLWSDLKSGWLKAQASYVEFLSEHFGREEYKVWDGYLLLWTADSLPEEDHIVRHEIQYNTGRVRKLVSTGDVLSVTGNVFDALLPLLPFDDFADQPMSEDPLERLPRILSSESVPEKTVERVISAFQLNDSIIQILFDSLDEKL